MFGSVAFTNSSIDGTARNFDDDEDEEDDEEEEDEEEDDKKEGDKEWEDDDEYEDDEDGGKEGGGLDGESFSLGLLTGVLSTLVLCGAGMAINKLCCGPKEVNDLASPRFGEANPMKVV